MVITFAAHQPEKVMKKTLAVILGATGSGKTKSSINLAEYFKTEIISVDSRQFYREMSIGTAIPSCSELSKIKHHFIHHISIHDYYNASRFEEEAIYLLGSLFEKYDLVLAAGGSMLYLDALCRGIDVLPEIDPDIRKNLKHRLEKEGIESLRFELRELDPDYYRSVDLKNPKRIIHALEICYSTGNPYSGYRKKLLKTRPFNIVKIGLECDRETLFDRINKRVDSMLAAGLIGEAEKMFPFKHLNPLNTVGYKELFDYFEGKTDLAEAIRLIKRNTRRYAKKQLTWFKRDIEINWFNYSETKKIIEFIRYKMNE